MIVGTLNLQARIGMSNRKFVEQPDDVFSGVKKTVELLNYMLGERSQLYGTVIYLMQLLGENSIAMPTLESMNEYHNTFAVSFGVEEDGFTVRLIDRTELPGEEEDG